MACNFLFKIDGIARSSLNTSSRFVEFSIHSSLLKTQPSTLKFHWQFKGRFERLLVSLKDHENLIIFIGNF